MIACESIQSKMTNQEPLDQFREIKDVVSHYDAIFASIKSPQTVNSEGLAIIRDRVAEMWASIAAADPDEREKLQENLLELGGQKKELEINYKANIKRWEALYQNRLRETMDEFRGKLAQTLVKNTARAQTHPQPQSLCQNQSKTQPQSHTQSQPPPQPQPQPGPQITVGDGSAKRTTEIRKTDKEPIMINLIEDEPEDDLEHKTEAELEDVPEDESEDEPEDEPEDDLKDDGPVLDDPVEEPVHEEPADEVMAENESAEINSAENETAETVPTKEESVENEKLGNLVTQESSRDGENLAPPSPPGNTITVGTSTMVRPSPDVETTCIMNTRSRETRSKRKAASPAPVAPIANKRQKFSRAASAGSAPGSKSGTPAEESRRSTRHSQRHSQSTGVQEFEGIANPEPGRVYLTFWAKTKEWLAVLLLPMGDFNSVGIPGSITSCGLSESLPSCYRFNKRTKKYTWAREYQDGMPLVSERIFPVMYFDGREFPHKSAIMWIEGKDLRKFHRRLGSSLVPNIKIILKYIEEHGGNQMEDDEEDVEVGQSEALGSQLPDIDEQEDSNIPEPTTAGSSKEEPQTHPTDACEDKQESEPLDDIKDPAPEAEPPVKIQKDSSVVARALSHPRLSAIAEHPFPMPTPPLSPGLHRRQLRHGGVKRLEEKPVVIDISDDESESDCNDKDNINVHVAHDESGSVWNDQDNIDAEVIYDDLESDWSIQASDTHDAFDTPSESPEDINASDTVVQCQAQPGESTVESQQPTVATDQPAQEDEGRATGSQIAQAALDHEAPCQDIQSSQTGRTDEQAPPIQKPFSINHLCHLYRRSPPPTNTSQSNQDYSRTHSYSRAPSNSRAVFSSSQSNSGIIHPQPQIHHQQPQHQEPTLPQTSQPSGQPTPSNFPPLDSNTPASGSVQNQEESYQVPVNRIAGVERRWQLQNERLQNEWLQNERMQNERLQNERLHYERLQNERLQNERLQNERLQNERLAVDRLHAPYQQSYQQTNPTEYQGSQEHLHEARDPVQQLVSDCYWTQHLQEQRDQRAPQHQPNQQVPHPNQRRDQQLLAQQAQLYLQAQAADAQHHQENSQSSHESSQRQYVNHAENYISNQTPRYPPPSSNMVLPSISSQITHTQPLDQQEEALSGQAPERFDQSYNPYQSIRRLSEYQDSQHAPVERRYHAQVAAQLATQIQDMRNTQAIAASAYQGPRPPAYQPTAQHPQTRQYMQPPINGDPGT